jgi:AcrR family transcriptional regulator
MKKQKTEVRKEQIKQAVLEIIHSEGLKNLSTRRVAREIGLSEGAIFRHFTSKKEIILSIMEDVKDQLLEPLRRVAFGTDDPEERLRNLLCVTVSYLVANKGITILLLSEASHENDADLKASLNMIFSTQRNLVLKVVRDGMSLGLWDPTLPLNSVTLLYMGIPISLNVQIVLNQDAFDEGTFCQEMYGLLLKLLK